MNKKRYITFTLFTLCLLLLCSCTKKDPIKTEFFNYINVDLEEIKTNEIESINLFDSIVSQDDYSYKELLASLDETIIPKYSKFLSDLENFEFETDEIENLNNIYIEGAKLQLKAFESLKTGIEEREQQSLDLALDYIEKSKVFMDSFQEQAIKLATDHDIKYK